MKIKLMFSILMIGFFNFADCEWAIESGLGFTSSLHQPGYWDNQRITGDILVFLSNAAFSGNALFYSEMGIGFPYFSEASNTESGYEFEENITSGILMVSLVGFGGKMDYWGQSGIWVFGLSTDLVYLLPLYGGTREEIFCSYTGPGFLMAIRNFKIWKWDSKMMASFRCSYNFFPIFEDEGDAGIAGMFHMQLSIGFNIDYIFEKSSVAN